MRQRHRVASLGSRFRASDRAGPDERRRASRPAPVGVVETCRCRDIERDVIATLVHRPRFRCPSRARPRRGTDDETAGFSVNLRLLRKVRVSEEEFWHANTARITDADDPRPGRHVITVYRPHLGVEFFDAVDPTRATRRFSPRRSFWTLEKLSRFFQDRRPRDPQTRLPRPATDDANPLDEQKMKVGVGNGVRTRDFRSHSPALYH